MMGWFHRLRIRLGWRRCRHCDATRRPRWAEHASTIDWGTLKIYRWMCPACWRPYG